MACSHNLWERETACADGMCPICLAEAVAAERERCAAQAKRLLSGLGIDGIAAEVSDLIRKGE